jgi:hypothetical protein
MPQSDIVAVTILPPASRVQYGFCAMASLHRPEPIEPPGPNDPDEDDDDAPPDPERLPGEPVPLPIGDPPPVHAPQGDRGPLHMRDLLYSLQNQRTFYRQITLPSPRLW